MTANALQCGDVVFKPNGFMDWPKWEHVISRIEGEVIYTVFCNGLVDSTARHANSILRQTDWMSVENMDACLQQSDTVVVRDGLVIHGELDR